MANTSKLYSPALTARQWADIYVSTPFPFGEPLFQLRNTPYTQNLSSCKAPPFAAIVADNGIRSAIDKASLAC